MEEVQSSAPDTIKWFQTFIFNSRYIKFHFRNEPSEHKNVVNRKTTEELVGRAEKAGYSALVVTVDAPVFGLRRSLIKNQFKIPKHLSFASLTVPRDSFEEFHAFNPIEKNTWNDLNWLVK